MQSEYEKESILKSDVRAFGNSAKDHWKELAGGSFIMIVFGWMLGIGLQVPEWIIGVSVFSVMLIFAAFLAFRDQRRKADCLIKEKVELITPWEQLITLADEANQLLEKFDSCQKPTEKASDFKERVFALFRKHYPRGIPLFNDRDNRIPYGWEVTKIENVHERMEAYNVVNRCLELMELADPSFQNLKTD